MAETTRDMERRVAVLRARFKRKPVPIEASVGKARTTTP